MNVTTPPATGEKWSSHHRRVAYTHPRCSKRTPRSRRKIFNFLIPRLWRNRNACVVRSSPPCRSTTHVIQSPQPSEAWICLVACQEHMRLEIAPCQDALTTLVGRPQSVAQPLGWRSLCELGPFEVAISQKTLGKCPHCQKNGVRLPLGIEGVIVGRAALYSDVQLRGYGQDGEWGENAARALGPLSLETWHIENATPHLILLRS